MKKAFGLIEILFAVIIIGIMGALMVPKVTGAQNRARDAARKANLNQATAAVSVYFSDNGVFPGEGASDNDPGTISLEDIRDDLVPVYINSIPKDPMKDRFVKILSPGTPQPGEYSYAPITRNQTKYSGMTIGANIESPGRNGNWLVLGNRLEIGENVPNNVGDTINLDNLGYIKTSSDKAEQASESIELEKTLCNNVNVNDNIDATMLDADDCIANNNNDMVYIVIQ